MKAERDDAQIKTSKKRVVLLQRPDDGIKTGLIRYADEVKSTLEASDWEFDVVPIRLDSKRGLLSFFKDGIVKPFVDFVLKRKGKNSIIHASDEMAGFFFPWTDGIRIVTVHHVISPKERGILYYAMWKILSTLAVKHADSIIAISNETATDVLSTFNVDPEKVVVVPNCPGSNFRQTGAQKTHKICCVGELTARKNISDSIRVFDAFLSLKDVSDYTMAICGKGVEKKSLIELIEDLGLSHKVSFTSDLDDFEMANFLESSMACLITSLHEGFGYVALEAQSCGTPTLHLSTSRLPELPFGASISCESVEDMAKKLHELVSDADAYQECVERSLAYAKGFRENFSKKLISAYHLGSERRAMENQDQS